MRGQHFLHTKSMGIFFKRSRADNSAARSRILCMLLFLASMEKIRLKIAEIMRGQHFLHTKSMGVVCCHSNQSSNPVCFKTLCRQCPTTMMLLIKFDCDRPTGL